MSPFDPIAMLDEIQRLVPGYDISRLGILAGQDEHTQLVQITGATGTGHPELILPSNDTLFTSGTLGRYSATLNTVMERYQTGAGGQGSCGGLKKLSVVSGQLSGWFRYRADVR